MLKMVIQYVDRISVLLIWTTVQIFDIEMQIWSPDSNLIFRWNFALEILVSNLKFQPRIFNLHIKFDTYFCLI